MYSEKLSELFCKISNQGNSFREDDFETVEKALKSIPDYMNCVIMSSTQISMAMSRYDDIQRGEVL